MQLIDKSGDLDQTVGLFEAKLIELLKTDLATLKTTDPQTYEAAVKSGYPVTVVFVQGNVVKGRDFHILDRADPSVIKIENRDCPGNGCAPPENHLFYIAGTHDAVDTEVAHPHRAVTGGSCCRYELSDGIAAAGYA